MISTTLNDYPRLPISNYSQQLKQDPKLVTGLEVRYQYRGRLYHYSLPLTTTQPNYGGLRYWFKCINCGKRVGVLYCADVFVCRHCIGAKYLTQHQQPLDRLFNRIGQLRQLLGWQGGIAYGKGSKPRYMHHRTYNRLVFEHDRLEQQVCGSVINWLDNNKVNIRYE